MSATSNTHTHILIECGGKEGVGERERDGREKERGWGRMGE